MSRIVLGVSGGIAAYKACDLLRRLQGAGHEVTVVPTAAPLSGLSTKITSDGARTTSACLEIEDGVHSRQGSIPRSSWPMPVP